MRYLIISLLLLACTPVSADQPLVVSLPDICVQNIEQDIEFTGPAGKLNDSLWIDMNGKRYLARFAEGRWVFSYNFPGRQTLTIKASGWTGETKCTPIPLWFSIFPPLIAILLALIIKEVFVSLFTGILFGTSLIYFYQGNTLFLAVGKGFLAIIDTYILQSLANTDHLSIILFSMIIGATVGLISRNGGMKGVVNYLSRFARTVRSGQLITWLMGMLIFFDDYANTLVVGNTMRPVTDRLKISREKLAYLVDSTAAPIASIGFVTTWIGAELSYIQDGIDKLGLNISAYSVFLNSLAYAFYPVLALIFILIISFQGRDFGPMLQAERKSRNRPDGATTDVHKEHSDTEYETRHGLPSRWFNAVIPVAVIIFGTMAGLLYTGWNPEIWASDHHHFFKKVSETIGASNSYLALLWASLSAMVVAVLLTLGQQLLSLKDTMEGLFVGFRTMLTAVFILVLAWSLALITEHLHTAEFISESLISLKVSPPLLPFLTFVLSALIAFSTGSSWGTMAILYPLLIPASWLLCKESGMDAVAAYPIFFNVVSAVLAGSVMGDHCSPISDTTIMSSLASSCNHIQHVRTQLPYALTIGGIAMFLGTLPSAYGISSWILFPLAILILWFLVRFAGGKTTMAR